MVSSEAGPMVDPGPIFCCHLERSRRTGCVEAIAGVQPVGGRA
jgi:hypothetical protein